MTTICWDGKTLAVDSQVTYGDDIMDAKAEKMYRNIGVFSVVCVAGSYDCADDYVRDIISNIEHPKELLDQPWCKDYSAIGILKKTQELWKMNGDATARILVPWAFGSGADFAIAAMDFGLSAVNAVKYAATRDTSTNTRVRSYTVKEV